MRSSEVHSRRRRWFVRLFIAIAVAAAISSGFWIGSRSVSGQAPSPALPRTADGKPDLNGIWQAMNTANWDLEEHAPRKGPLAALGARGAIPGGIGFVEGGEIPYLPEALAQKKRNQENWLQGDPTIKCFLPGTPRATYMPFPFQIVQGNKDILLAYKFANASRVIYMKSTEESPADTWMGWSRGRWEGDSLVVEVNSFNDQTWFDTAGNHHSDALKVVERYTPIDRDHLLYEAVIEDSKTFSRPWTIRMPLYRHVEPNARLLEFNCPEFAEDVMYGHLRKKAAE